MSRSGRRRVGKNEHRKHQLKKKVHTNNAILRPRVTPAPAMEPASPIPPWIEKPEECRWFYGDERPVSAIPETRYPDGRSVVVFVEGNLVPRVAPR